MTLPRIALAVPYFNQENYIVQAIDSVLSQSYEGHITIVASDDASTDNSRARLEQFLVGKELPDNRKVILMRHFENVGAHENIDSALEWVPEDVDYCGILEGDDFLKPTSIEKKVNYLLETGYDGVHTDVDHLFEDGSIWQDFWAYHPYLIESPMSKEFLLMNNRVFTCSFIGKRDLFIKAYSHRFLKSLGIVLADYACSLRFIHFGGLVGYLPDSLSCYRVLSGSMSHSLTRDQLLGETWKVQNMGRSGEIYG